MRKINVVDAPCGYGKTSWAIQYMNEMSTDSHRFIFITPFLAEVERVKTSVTERRFYEPETKNGETKMDSLHHLIEEDLDICTTHALFRNANHETVKLLKEKNYTLILDEVMNGFEQVKLKKDDLTLLINADAAYIYEKEYGTKYIGWNDSIKHYDTKYNSIKNMALAGNLMYCNSSAVIWNFPCEVFKLFKDVFILTYMFVGQLQRYYYEIHGIKYNLHSVKKNHEKYNLVTYRNRCIHNKEHLMKNINIYQGKLNEVGNGRHKLSSSWLKNNDNRKALSKHSYNYLTNILKCAKFENTIWTTLKHAYEVKKTSVSPKNFKKAFLPVTQRATNEYKHKYNLAYLVNRFMNPIEVKFFEQYGIKVDQDTWALSELIQWVWRSRIRDGEAINIYIPSRRMRNLFERYLNGDEFESVPSEIAIDEYCSDWHV